MATFEVQIKTLDCDLLINNCDMDLNLQKYFHRNSVRPEGYIPKVNEIVAVWKISDKRWIRARVDNVYHFCVNGPKYVLWAIDYSEPIVSKEDHIRPLPVEFQIFQFFGDVINLLPAEMTLDDIEISGELEHCNKKTSTSCEIFEILQESSEQCSFAVGEISKCQSFGQLENVNCSNETLNLNQVLCKENLDLEYQGNEFFDKVKSFQLNKSKWCLTEKGDYKLLCYENIKNNLCLPPLKVIDLRQVSISFGHNRRLVCSDDSIENFQNEEKNYLTNVGSDNVAENILENLRNMKIEVKQYNKELSLVLEIPGNSNDDNLSLISYSNISRKKYMVERRNKILGKNPQKINRKEISNDTIITDITKISQKHIFNKSEIKPETDHNNEQKNVVNDTTQSVLSDPAVTSRKKFLAERKNKVLRQKARGNENPRCLENEMGSLNNTQESDSKNDSLKLPVEQETSLIKNTKSLNSSSQSIEKDFSKISREKFLDQRRRNASANRKLWF